MSVLESGCLCTTQICWRNDGIPNHTIHSDISVLPMGDEEGGVSDHEVWVVNGNGSHSFIVGNLTRPEALIVADNIMYGIADVEAYVKGAA